MSTVAARTTSPWSRVDHIGLGLGMLASLAVLAVAWYQASGHLLPRDQMEPVNVGVIGIAVAALASGLYIQRGRALVSRRRLELVAALRDSDLYRMRVAAQHVLTERQGGTRSALLVAAGSMTRYHRPDCLLVADKSAAPMGRSEHERAGRVPCGVCTP